MGIKDMLLAKKRHEAEDKRLARCLREMILRQIAEVNEAVGKQLLYVNECAGHLFLYGNPGGGHIDRLMACVPLDVEGLARLWYRLSEGIREGRTVEDACPYKKERVTI